MEKSLYNKGIEQSYCQYCRRTIEPTQEQQDYHQDCYNAVYTFRKNPTCNYCGKACISITVSLPKDAQLCCNCHIECFGSLPHPNCCKKIIRKPITTGFFTGYPYKYHIKKRASQNRSLCGKSPLQKYLQYDHNLWTQDGMPAYRREDICLRCIQIQYGNTECYIGV